MKSVRVIYLLLMSILLSLSGCGDQGDAEMTAWMAGVQKQARIPVEKIDEIKKFVPMDYTENKSIDPYNPQKLLTAIAKMQTQSGSPLQPNMQRPREALEAYPVDAIKMVGTLKKANLRYALLQIDKAVFSVKIGNYVGQDFGMVTNITDNAVELRESIQEFSGAWVERKTKIVMQEEKNDTVKK